MHRNGIFHRDIKPENLLLSHKDLGVSSLKIADFGLSNVFDNTNLLSTFCGSPLYASPETSDCSKLLQSHKIFCKR